MTDTTATPATPPMKRIGRRWRGVIVIILGVLSCIALLTSTVGVWTHRTLLNTDSWVNAVGPLAKDPQVIAAVSTTITTEVMQALDVEKVAENALPAKASFLAEPLEVAAQQFVSRAVTQLLNTKQFQQFWVQANRIARPAAAVKVLKGETKGVTTANGVVALNLLPLVAKALTFVESKAPGIGGTSSTVPDITFSTPVDQARSELSTALGHTLPENFGVITVFKSDQLKAAQEGLKLFNALIIALLIITVVLFALTIFLARRRRRAVIALALGSVVTLVIATAVVKAVKDQIVGLVGNEQARDAAKATISQLVSRLDLITHGLLALGVAVAVIAFVTGDSRSARRVRRVAARLGRFLAGGAAPDVVPRPVLWAHKHVTALRWAGAAVAVLALLFVVSGWVGLLVTVVLIGLFEASLTYVAARPISPASGAGAT